MPLAIYIVPSVTIKRRKLKIYNQKTINSPHNNTNDYSCDKPLYKTIVAHKHGGDHSGKCGVEPIENTIPPPIRTNAIPIAISPNIAF
jgi:hypothetical protein